MARSSPSPESSGLAGLSEVIGLWCLVVVVPLLDLLGRNAPFLLHHRLDGIDLAVWLLVVGLLAPVAIWLAARLASGWLGRPVGSVALGVLLGALLLGTLRRLGDPLPLWLLPPLAIGAAWAGTRLIREVATLRTLFRFLALALPVVATLFWVSPAASAARAAAAARPGSLVAAPGRSETVVRSGAGVPVVLVVFDELPLVSLLDADLGIDADLCPNLAALVAGATWYRNASTVWSSTNPSIVSMLVGRRVEEGEPPTRQRYPSNLLTWLDATHDVRAFEPLTAMAPPGRVELGLRQPRSRRIRAVAVDTAIVVSHQLLPPPMGAWLPAIDNRWGDFGDGRIVRGRVDADAEPAERRPWSFALADARAAQFESFLDSIEKGPEPGLYFAHVMLPHMPYRYLPSGRVYGGRPVYQRAATAWMENEWFALETYQRHLLQVGFVDRLVGRLSRRLREVGIWERSLVILTSDHGASHWPGQDRRLPTATDHPDDILRVPLVVKAPGQSAGRLDDRPATTLDLVPTVADALGQAVPWEASGRSLLAVASATGAAGERRLDAPGGAQLTFGADFAPDAASLGRKLALFDPAAGLFRWVRFGPYRRLVGRTESDVAASVGLPSHRCVAEVDQLPVLADWDRAGRYSPALLTGEVRCSRSLPPSPFVLAALNGRVAGSAALQGGTGPNGAFALMTAEGVLRAGANELRLYLATSAGPETRLEPIELRADRAAG